MKHKPNHLELIGHPMRPIVSILRRLNPNVDCPHLQITSSSVGINPIASENGPIKILRTHMMLSTFGITSPTEAGTMTHAHTFGKRSATLPFKRYKQCLKANRYGCSECLAWQRWCYCVFYDKLLDNNLQSN